MKWFNNIKNLGDSLVAYWYGTLEEKDRLSIVTMTLLLLFCLVIGLLMPSWASASGKACSPGDFPDLTEDQVYTMEVCADLAFEDASVRHGEEGPLVAFAYLSYRVGWCVYHEVYPNHGVHQYHEWLADCNASKGLDYFF